MIFGIDISFYHPTKIAKGKEKLADDNCNLDSAKMIAKTYNFTILV
jgi:hypothetical protein